MINVFVTFDQFTASFWNKSMKESYIKESYLPQTEW